MWSALPFFLQKLQSLCTAPPPFWVSRVRNRCRTPWHSSDNTAAGAAKSLFVSHGSREVHSPDGPQTQRLNMRAQLPKLTPQEDQCRPGNPYSPVANSSWHCTAWGMEVGWERGESLRALYFSHASQPHGESTPVNWQSLMEMPWGLACHL